MKAAVSPIAHFMLVTGIIWELRLFFPVGTIGGLPMFTKSLQIGFVGLVLFVVTAWAGP